MTNEKDEWDPQPAELREGETADEGAHSQATLEQLRIAHEEGVIEGEELEAAQERLSEGEG